MSHAVMMSEQHNRMIATACLTDEQVVRLREERAAGGTTLRGLVAKWGLSASAICKITRGRSYRWVGGPITSGRAK
jgi:hypothetical protein